VTGAGAVKMKEQIKNMRFYTKTRTAPDINLKLEIHLFPLADVIFII
jgi:hypothetical protein